MISLFLLRCTHFLIDEKFPNLNLSNKPKQIENLKYDIDITQCDDWKNKY